MIITFLLKKVIYMEVYQSILDLQKISIPQTDRSFQILLKQNLYRNEYILKLHSKYFYNSSKTIFSYKVHRFVFDNRKLLGSLLKRTSNVKRKSESINNRHLELRKKTRISNITVASSMNSTVENFDQFFTLTRGKDQKIQQNRDIYAQRPLGEIQKNRNNFLAKQTNIKKLTPLSNHRLNSQSAIKLSVLNSNKKRSSQMINMENRNSRIVQQKMSIIDIGQHEEFRKSKITAYLSKKEKQTKKLKNWLILNRIKGINPPNNQLRKMIGQNFAQNKQFSGLKMGN